jgi:hypothetical protein
MGLGGWIQYTRRIKGRPGKAEGLTAGAHKLTRILYGMILHQRPYDEETVSKAPPPASLSRAKTSKNKPLCSGCNSLRSNNWAMCYSGGSCYLSSDGQ